MPVAAFESRTLLPAAKYAIDEQAAPIFFTKKIAITHDHNFSDLSVQVLQLYPNVHGLSFAVSTDLTIKHLAWLS